MHFYTRHTRGKHQAFDPDHNPLTGPCPTEIDLVQKLKKGGIDISDYEGVGRKPVDSPWYKVITTWTRKEPRVKDMAKCPRQLLNGEKPEIFGGDDD